MAADERQLLLLGFEDTLLLEQGLSQLTIRAYVSDVRQFCDYLQARQRPLSTFAPEDVEGFLGSDHERCARSLARFLCSLRAFVRYLQDEGRRSDDPLLTIARPRFAMKLPAVMSEESVELMLEAPDLMTFVGMRDRAMLETVYATGLRVSELVGLKFENLNLTDCFVLIRGKGGKERIVPLGEQAVYYIESYLASERSRRDPRRSCPYVFLSSKGLGPMTRVAFWYRVKAYAREIGLAVLPSPHTFRHAFATHLLNHDADLRTVQMLLGHSSLSITQIYTHVATARMHAVYDRSHPRS